MQIIVYPLVLFLKFDCPVSIARVLFVFFILLVDISQLLILQPHSFSLFVFVLGEYE